VADIEIADPDPVAEAEAGVTRNTRKKARVGSSTWREEMDARYTRETTTVHQRERQREYNAGWNECVDAMSDYEAKWQAKLNANSEWHQHRLELAETNVRVLERALRKAGVDVEEVDYATHSDSASECCALSPKSDVESECCALSPKSDVEECGPPRRRMSQIRGGRPLASRVGVRLVPVEKPRRVGLSPLAKSATL
jgi:hypothetical protein